METEVQRCPYCSQPVREPAESDPFTAPSTNAASTPYFHILERAHESSRPSSPAPKRTARASQLRFSQADAEASETDEEELGTSKGAEGYYERFFREECRLGIGAEGSVYLAQHVIGGNVLGKSPPLRADSRLVRRQEGRSRYFQDLSSEDAARSSST